MNKKQHILQGVEFIISTLPAGTSSVKFDVPAKASSNCAMIAASISASSAALASVFLEAALTLLLLAPRLEWYDTLIICYGFEGNYN